MTPTPEELRDWSAEKVMGWWLKESIDEYGNKTGEWYSGDEYTGYDKYYIHSDGEDVSNDLTWLWRPDTDLNQVFMVVERMRELGWYLYCEPEPNMTFPNYKKAAIIYEIGFYHPENMKLELKPSRGFVMYDRINAHAILLAAHATGEGQGEKSCK